MSNLVTDTVVSSWRSRKKTKVSPSGWISGNAVCCNDRRGRGGLRLGDDGSWVWHCFNCQYKTSWRPGKFITERNKQFFQKLGMSDQQISEIGMEALRLRELGPAAENKARSLSPFKPVPLPPGAMPITQALENYPEDADLVAVCEYVLGRGLELERYLWTNQEQMQRRFIIPFSWQGQTVGWTARAIDPKRMPKYLSNVSNGYVYGLDRQDPDNQYVILSEGVLDADSCGGCAVLGNNVSPAQQDQIEALGKRVIWVPDRDEDGVRLAQRALDLDWMVSIPNWADGCKDINDAVILYGRSATLLSIIEAASSSRAATMLKLAPLKRRITKAHG